MGGGADVQTDKTISDGSIDGPETERATILAGRYALVSLIGSGGMGAVYRARDLELDEVVALKMLNRGFDRRDASVQRFRREVKLARRVTHKNVARTFDIGEHEGERFLTMELIDGTPLSAYARASELPLSRVVEIATELCAGLSAAHAAGVVHRDLKPDNVMVGNDSRIVITDFGIACAASNDPDEPRGLMMGTPAYMAPEQVEGATDIDARADLYALGTILYELVTGSRPWRGPGVYNIAAQKLVSPPPDPRDTRPNLPDGIAAVILRCMAKERTSRFTDADSVAHALAAALTGTSPAPPATVNPRSPPPRSAQRRKDVAVLPFRCDDPEDLHIAYGLTDDIIDVLSGSPDLRVRARGGVEREALRDRDPCGVGRTLGVEVVVEGSVRRVDAGIRVTLRVLSVADGFQLWARRYEVPLSLAFSIGDEAAAAVCEAVTLEFHGAPRVHSADSGAIDLYMRARHAYQQISRESLERAIVLFQQALERAPDDPRILAGLAMAQTRHLYYAETVHSVDNALASARKAVALGPEHVEARTALASILLGTGDYIASAREAAAALRTGPDHPDAIELVARFLGESGRTAESIAAYEAVLAVDPSRDVLRYEIVRLRALTGDWDSALALADESPQPGSVNMYWLLRWRLLMWRRDKEGAQEALATASKGTFEFRTVAIAMLSFIAGVTGPEAALEDIRARSQGMRAVRLRVLLHQMTAEVCALLGDSDATLAALQAADAVWLLDILWLDHCPLLDDYRTDPTFLAVRSSVAERAAAILAQLAPPAPLA